MNFNASDLKAFALEISDRQIYNDIRSETDVTEETETQADGTPAEYQEVEVCRDGPLKVTIAANSSEDVTFTAEAAHTSITWKTVDVTDARRPFEYGLSESECVSQDGTWYAPHGSYPSACYFPDIAGTVSVQFTVKGKTTATARVTNPHNYEIWAIPKAIYRYLAQEAIEGAVTIHTETRTLTVRATDADSIAKYGRRVMNLVWPMGQSEEQAQSLVDAYRDRYCEPVCFASMVLEGSTDAKITQLLDMDIDDKHQFIHPGLDMDEEFFINNLGIELNREGTGILTGTFGLEQARDMEGYTLFTLDVSELDGAHVLGS